MTVTIHTLTSITACVWLKKLAFANLKHLLSLQNALIENTSCLATEAMADA